MFVRHLAAIMLGAVLALFGCSTAPTSPPGDAGSVITYTTSDAAQRAVFTAKSAYASALSLAVAYKNLPACGGAASLCSNPEIVAQLQKADNVAAAALDAAEAAVRTPSVGTTARDRAIQTANSALAALSALVTNLGVSR